ncbi:MAG: hypothetical protein R2822_13625 [Spirosomataceae bacterium]
MGKIGAYQYQITTFKSREITTTCLVPSAASDEGQFIFRIRNANKKVIEF